MKTHELKTWPEFFGPVLSGEKTFEWRKNDRGFQVGDILHMREYEPKLGEWDAKAEKWGNGGGSYSGRECFRRVTYVLEGSRGAFGVQAGFAVLGIVPTDPRGYEKRTDSPTNQFISMVTGEALADDADDDARMGCSKCWNAMTGHEGLYNKLLASEWSQCGEDEMLCPFCTREAAADAKEQYEAENGPSR